MTLLALFSQFSAATVFPSASRGSPPAQKKIVLMLSYPSDEVGNHLVDLDALDEKESIHGATF